ncbi:IclR family transcriptional regulator C-terminal domain-containing protein [Hydrogenophaga sp. 2FB]|uniref:IclR family transcriptional regulator domain-containing protein n=1 Tax=Hydrogenophaga sp. 2FB TaxID=2502187 RepID=UPI0010F6A3F0|nr:IclR family transcriptional regulator C-terminal domain-containing protein [Hydrogenophaga sp. 2FB]
MTTTDETRNKDHMGGLKKGIRILEAFDSIHTRMTVTEAALRVGLSPASARRCLITLCELGYAQTDGKRYWLGHGALRLSYAYASSTKLPRLIQPVLDAMSERSRESASLAVLLDGAAVIAARSTARRTLRIGLVVGSRLPLYCSAAGRALLASLPESEAVAMLRGMERPKLTVNTVTDIDKLKKVLANVRQTGYAVCDEEIEIGVRSIAAPLFNTAGETVASVSISTRADRMTVNEIVQAYLPILKKNQLWAQARLT